MKLGETIDKILFNYSLVMTQSELREKAIAEIFSALASTPDEELRLTKREQCPLFDDWYKTVQADYKSHAFDLIRATTNAQLTKVQPVITALRAKLAEAEKEKQQAVEQERERIMSILSPKAYPEDEGMEFQLTNEEWESLVSPWR